MECCFCCYLVLQYLVPNIVYPGIKMFILYDSVSGVHLSVNSRLGWRRSLRKLFSKILNDLNGQIGRKQTINILIKLFIKKINKVIMNFVIISNVDNQNV